LLAPKKRIILAEEMTANESNIIFSHGENDGQKVNSKLEFASLYRHN
jgi:hypothetical protein